MNIFIYFKNVNYFILYVLNMKVNKINSEVNFLNSKYYLLYLQLLLIIIYS